MDLDIVTSGGTAANVNNCAILNSQSDNKPKLMELCSALDELELGAQTRVGGASPADDLEISRLYAAIHERETDSLEATLWRANLLARAVLNNWHDNLAYAIAVKVERDIAAMAIGNPQY